MWQALDKSLMVKLHTLRLTSEVLSLLLEEVATQPSLSLRTVVFGALHPHHNILATQASPPRTMMASVSGLEGDIKSVEMSSDMVYLCADSHSSESHGKI